LEPSVRAVTAAEEPAPANNSGNAAKMEKITALRDALLPFLNKLALTDNKGAPDIAKMWAKIGRIPKTYSVGPIGTDTLTTLFIKKISWMLTRVESMVEPLKI